VTGDGEIATVSLGMPRVGLCCLCRKHLVGRFIRHPTRVVEEKLVEVLVGLLSLLFLGGEPRFSPGPSCTWPLRAAHGSLFALESLCLTYCFIYVLLCP